MNTYTVLLFGRIDINKCSSIHSLNCSGHQGRTQSDDQWPRVWVPLISRPVANYREGGTTPLWGVRLSWSFEAHCRFFSWPEYSFSSNCIMWARYFRVMCFCVRLAKLSTCLLVIRYHIGCYLLLRTVITKCILPMSPASSLVVKIPPFRTLYSPSCDALLRGMSDLTGFILILLTYFLCCILLGPCGLTVGPCVFNHIMQC